MMRLRRRLALGLVDNFLHPRDLTVVGIGQKTNIVIGIRRQNLGDRAELRGKIGVSEKKSHGKKRDLVN
jgi:hypothetical protein